MKTTCPWCRATWSGTAIEHCAACCRTFTGTEAGDLHRVGTFEPLDRRCLSPWEMRTRKKNPLEQNERGHWRKVPTDGKAHWRVAATTKEGLEPESGVSGTPQDSRPLKNVVGDDGE